MIVRAAVLAAGAVVAFGGYRLVSNSTSSGPPQLVAEVSGYMSGYETITWAFSSSVTGYSLSKDGLVVASAGPGATTTRFYVTAGVHTLTVTALHQTATTTTGVSTTSPTTTAPTTTTSSTLGTALPARISLKAPSIVYYVDPLSGSDSNSSSQARSLTTAWKTLTHALAAVPVPAVGSNTPVEVMVRGGLQRGFTITDAGPGSTAPAGFTNVPTDAPARLSFPADSPLTITNYPGERVLISFRLYLNIHDSYVRIAGQTVSGKKGLVFDVRYPSGLTAGSPVSAVGSQHIEIFNTEIRNGNWNGLGGCVYVGGYDNGSIYSKAIDIQIISNYIHHCGGVAQGAHGIYFGGTYQRAKGAQGGAIYNNVVAWNTDDNISPHNSDDGLLIANNTVVGYGGGGNADGTVSSIPLTGTGVQRSFNDAVTFFSSSSDPYTVNTKVKNNVFAYVPDYGLNDYDSHLNSSNSEDHNLYYGNGGTRRATAGMVLASTLLNSNPLFVSGDPRTNPAANLHVLAGSPAAGAGDPAYTPSFDFDGNTRSQADLGAFKVG